MLRKRAFLLFIILIGSVHCAGSDANWVVAPSAGIPPISAVAVSSVDLDFDAPPWIAYQRTSDVIQTVSTLSVPALIGPQEFKITAPRGQNLLRMSTVLIACKKYDIPAKGVVALNVRIERPVATAMVTAVPSDPMCVDCKTSQAGAIEGHSIIIVEARHAGVPGVVAEARRKVDLDPFAEHPDWDAQSEEREALIALTRRVLLRLIDEAGFMGERFEFPFDGESTHGEMMHFVRKDEASLALLIRVLSESPIIWTTAYGIDPEALVLAAMSGIGLGLLTVFVTWLLEKVAPPIRRLSRSFRAVLGPLTLFQAIGLALLSGFAEELLFRGVLQPRIGWVLASILFGLIHIPPERKLIAWTAFALIMGFALAGLYEWTGGLLAPILAHMVVNGINLYRIGQLPDPDLNEGEDPWTSIAALRPPLPTRESKKESSSESEDGASIDSPFS